MAEPGARGDPDPSSLSLAPVAGLARPPDGACPEDESPPRSPAIAAPSNLFGTALAPALREACGGRLSPIEWFRTDWQRGGALTGYASFVDDAGTAQPVVVKLPVPPQELLWLLRLQPDRHGFSAVVPRVFAGDRSVGGYDLAWVVMQRMPHGPLDRRWAGRELELLVEAAGRFYAAAGSYPVDQPAREEDWPGIVERSRRAVREIGLADRQRWKEVLRPLQKKLPRILERWGSGEADRCWCHGDLHLGNAMTEAAAPGGPAVLLDLAMVHAGHWVEDAVYLEHLHWCRPERLGGRNVVKMLAEARRRWGLKTADWPERANARRVLLAAAAPGQASRQHRPAFLRAALEKLERLLPQLG